MLTGLKVIELAGVLAGPSAGMFLAELGAEVIKIENPLTNGDVTRSWKLPDENAENGISTYFSCANWGKRSVGVNISTSEGKKIIYELLRDTDIVITSFKKGDDLKLGMDYQTLKVFNERLIYASISGYGEDDERIAYDAVLQAESGFMSMNGTLGSGPLKFPVAIVDLFAAHQLKEGILLAIIERYKTGKGINVNISLWQSALSALANQATNFLMQNHIPKAEGSLHPNIAPYGETFETKDGKFILLAVGSQKQFENLCHILGLQKMPEDERFITNQNRLKNRQALQAFLKDAIYGFNAAELTSKLNEKKIPAGIVQTVGEALKNANQEYILSENNIKALSQLAFHHQTKKNILPPPEFGMHTQNVLQQQLNYSLEEIKALKMKGIIA